jgi:hypothetical protein
MEVVFNSFAALSADLASDEYIIKIDFINAFNCASRQVIFDAVAEFFPELLPFVTACYSTPTSLFFGEVDFLSAEGVQQGDPLGPALFSLNAAKADGILAAALPGLFRMWYLDDLTVMIKRDDCATLFRTLRLLEALGLAINFSKCEIIGSSVESLLPLAPWLPVEIPQANIRCTTEWALLGSPIGSDESVG